MKLNNRLIVTFVLALLLLAALIVPGVLADSGQPQPGTVGTTSMELDITKVLEVIILVIIAPLMPIVVFKLRQWVNANVSLAQQRQIEAAVTAAVLAAEQLGLSGDEARNRAIMMAESTLKQYGLKVEFGVIASLIEAEVMSQFNHPVYAKVGTVVEPTYDDTGTVVEVVNE